MSQSKHNPTAQNPMNSSDQPAPNGLAGGAPDDNKEGQIERLACYNPAFGRLIAELIVPGPEEIAQTVKAARAAFKRWRQLTVEERVKKLRQAEQVLLANRRQLLDLLIAETGKPQADAQAEFLTLFETFRYYTSHAAELLADETVRVHLLKNKRVRVQYNPLGVVLNISPWNFPLDLSLTPAIPALLAGNAVLIKPSEHTPLTVMRAVELMSEEALPAGLLQVVIGAGEVGEALSAQADAISFTGSVNTGRAVAKVAAERLIPCTLELGGKDPAIVLEDADLERAARGIVWGAFFNSGQVCMGVERVYVHEAIHDDFVQRVVELTSELRQGVSTNEAVDIGAMIDPAQLQVIEAHLDDAAAKGAQILAGGERVEPRWEQLYPDVPQPAVQDYEDMPEHDRAPILRGADFFAPTVLSRVDHSMQIMQDETFGPILPIMKVSSAEEAIQLANETQFGLNASVWSRDLGRARQVADALRAGQVCINDVITSYLAVEAPYGGVKNSGLGRRKGPGEIYKFVESKTVLEDILKLKREPYWYPYHPKMQNIVDKTLGALYQRGVTRKISDLFLGPKNPDW